MMTSPRIADKASSLYEADYLAWIETNLEKLKGKNYDSVDWENLLEEISDMARREKRGLRSHLSVVLLHLLKWHYQPERRTRSWLGSIAEHRNRIQDALQDSPSLKTYLEEFCVKAYRNAVKVAIAETGLPADKFPKDCPYAIAQILDDEFLPE